jgi:hypothetical protein
VGIGETTRVRQEVSTPYTIHGRGLTITATESEELGLAAFEDLLVETCKEDGEVKNREITEEQAQALEKGAYDRHFKGKFKTNIFPKYFLPCVQHPLNTQLKTEDTYLLIVGIHPMLDFYQDWKENK